MKEKKEEELFKKKLRPDFSMEINGVVVVGPAVVEITETVFQGDFHKFEETSSTEESKEEPKKTKSK